MSLVAGVYKNNGTYYAPRAHTLQLGQQPLLFNVSSAQTSDPFPYIQAKNVFSNIMICAETWGSASVSIQVSYDGINCWMPLLSSNTANTALTNIVANTYLPIILRDVFIRAVCTGTGTNVSVLLS